MTKGWKWDSAHKDGRCGHPYCTDCRKLRGRNRGNRNIRHAVKTLLHKTKEKFDDR